jgi:hypothetical protein
MSKLRLQGATSGFVELAAPDVSDDGVLVLPTAAEGILAASGGIGSNVVQTVKTDTFSSSIARGAVTTLTGLSATITPSSNTSLVLVLYTVNCGLTDAAAQTTIVLRRGGTSLFIGNADGVRDRRTSGANVGSNAGAGPTSGIYLDSPASDSPVVYDLAIGHTRFGTDTVWVNRGQQDSNDSGTARFSSSITAIEVKA